jgi:hypothetical protein
VPHRPNTRGTDAREPNDYKGKGAIAQASLHGFDLLTIQAGLCASLNMRDRLWSVQEGGQDDVGEVPADTREMMTLKNGDFCIFPEKVHSTFHRF